MDSLARDSQLGLGLGTLEVGDEIGGVTGALFEIRRGGRDEGMELYRNGRRFREEALASVKDKFEDEGLGWYEGIALGKEDDAGLGFWEELGVLFVEVPAMSVDWGGLHP